MREKIRTHLKRGETASGRADNAVGALLGMLGFAADLGVAFDTWDKETRALVRGCEAVAIQGRKLCVKVPSTTHRQELIYAKERIISRINQAMGRRAITDIVFELEAGAQPRPAATSPWRNK